MTSDEIACLRALRHGCKGALPPCECDIPGCLGDDGESEEAPLPVLQKLLDEREALLVACKAVLASDAELNARIAPEHMGDAWYSRRLELERRERAALDAVKKAIAKAEAP